MVKYRMNRLKEIIKQLYIYKVYLEWKIWQSEKVRFINELNDYKDISADDRKRYISSLKYYRISPSEYFRQYKFDKLSKSERAEYITRSEMQKVYRKLVKPEIRKSFYNKVLFLNTFASVIKRRWILADCSANKDALVELLTSVDTIVKPIEGSLGNGIYKINRNSIVDPRSLADKLMRDGVLVEECVCATDEIQSYHPNSLNTIRVVTFSNSLKSEVLGAFIRFGCHGSVVDNAHAGGVFATIDVKTGEVISNGLDTDGKEYVNHPDTNKPIKGLIIPNWELVVNTCLRATKIVPGLKFAGWDCVVLPHGGGIDIIEGSHGPDVDVMQSPLRKGIRTLISSKLKEYFDYKL